MFYFNLMINFKKFHQILVVAIVPVANTIFFANNIFLLFPTLQEIAILFFFFLISSTKYLCKITFLLLIFLPMLSALSLSFFSLIEFKFPEKFFLEKAKIGFLRSYLLFVLLRRLDR